MTARWHISWLLASVLSLNATPPLAIAQAGLNVGLNGELNGGLTWRGTKCARYKDSWDEALRRSGTSGLTPDFINDHAAFIRSGCETPATVCPRTKAELALANILVIRAMNAGTASTFLPFRCGR